MRDSFEQRILLRYSQMGKDKGVIVKVGLFTLEGSLDLESLRSLESLASSKSGRIRLVLSVVWGL